MSYEDFRVSIGPLVRGVIEVTRREVTWVEAASRPCDFEAGPITNLYVGPVLMMSDALREYREHDVAIERAHGRVLVNGLGLGCYVKAILAKPEVESVEVVELLPDVIEAIGPYYTSDPRVTILHADAFDQSRAWPRGTRWDCVWSDIWPAIDEKYLPEMTRLNRSYGARATWAGSWAQREIGIRRKAEAKLREQLGIPPHVQASYGSIASWA